MKWSRACLDGIEKLRAEGRVTERRPAAPADPIRERLSERDFMAAVIDLAKRNGWLCYHTHDSRKSAAGFPDLVLIRGPVLIVAELKVGTNQPTADQRTWLEAFAGAGVEAHVWRPEDWPNILEVLR